MPAKPLLITLILIAGLGSRLDAQAPAAEQPIDMAARRQSVVTLKLQIEQRQERQDELLDEIKRADDRIEKRIDKLVKMLSELKDSEQSKTRVSMIKSRAIKGLRAMIQVYLGRRRDIYDSLRRHADTLPIEEGNKVLTAFDERIQKRISQILELSDSMTEYKDTEKYESDGGSYWNGWWQESTRINPAWRQNRRDTVQTEVQRNELSKAMEGAVNDMKQRRAAIDDTLAHRKLTSAEREVQLEEVGRLDAAIERMESEREDLITRTGDTARDAIGLDQAVQVEQLINDSSSDLSDDFSRMMSMIDEYLKELAQTYRLTENLKAREAWLKEHDKEGAGN